MLQCRVLIITTVVPIISKWFCGLLSYFFHFFLFFFSFCMCCVHFVLQSWKNTEVSSLE